MPQSINQNLRPDALPDFRNLGVILRIVLLTNVAALATAMAQAASWREAAQRIVDISALLQPILICVLLLLFALSPLLSRLAWLRGAAAITLLSILSALAIRHLGGQLYEPLAGTSGFYAWRCALFSAAVAILLLAYFRLRAQALSPALPAARLQALQARIRPHFLFNSINAVLGIVRADPKRAETALEDMSDLFRMAMTHAGDLVPARQEIALTRQYLALEQLRLGDRLKIGWHIDLPDDTLMPPLMLQPLLENAIYHGIEPLAEGGMIDVRLYRSGNEIHLEMYNPRLEQPVSRRGNRIALANIRERLALQFDIEARYTVASGKDFYRVHIMLPYVKEKTDGHG